MDYQLTLGGWEEQKSAAREVRLQVFVVEQNVPVEMEWDEMDEASLHVVVTDADGKPVGTGRLLPDGHIGRMAVVVRMRGRSIGSMILRALLDAAEKRGDTESVLHAQTHAKNFYERFGFFCSGEEFMEAGIPHVMMRRTIRR